MSKEFVENVKRQIEEKYAAIREAQIRNSEERSKKETEERCQKLSKVQIDFLPVEDIREIFMPFIKDRESFAKFTDEEIYELYIEWYKNTLSDIEEEYE